MFEVERRPFARFRPAPVMREQWIETEKRHQDAGARTIRPQRLEVVDAARTGSRLYAASCVIAVLEGVGGFGSRRPRRPSNFVR
jgi:hypothetical protein